MALDGDRTYSQTTEDELNTVNLTWLRDRDRVGVRRAHCLEIQIRIDVHNLARLQSVVVLRRLQREVHRGAVAHSSVLVVWEKFRKVDAAGQA